ncbi:MAG: sugar phosphate isomerase/epimerase family protein [Limisphaerales bacterium]
MQLNRRKSLGVLGMGLAAAAANPAFGDHHRKSPKICFFTKMFQDLSFDELASLTAELGMSGVEATIRPGGHIEPEAAPDKLPALVAAMRKKKREVTIMASGINSATDKKQRAESVLRTASKLGVKHYRMSYYRYDLKKPLKPQLANFRSELKELAALNKELGIQALYQNHAGNKYVGAPIWDICELVEDLPREAVALAFDIRHAHAEGGLAWSLNARRAMPMAGSVYVKDYVWNGPKVVNVPLGEGRVDKKFFKDFKIARFPGPISLHVEYLHRDEPNVATKGKAAYANDLATLKQWLKG